MRWPSLRFMVCRDGPLRFDLFVARFFLWRSRAFGPSGLASFLRRRHLFMGDLFSEFDHLPGFSVPVLFTASPADSNSDHGHTEGRSAYSALWSLARTAGSKICICNLGTYRPETSLGLWPSTACRQTPGACFDIHHALHVPHIFHN